MTIFEYNARRNEIENDFAEMIAREGSPAIRWKLRRELGREIEKLDRSFGH